MAVHPRYLDEPDYRRLRAAIKDDMTELSMEALARLSWVIAQELAKVA